MSSNSVERCRWRRRIGSASRRPPNNGTHSTRLEAFTDVSLELRSSRLLQVSSRLLCSKSNVELHCSLDDDFPARNSRADATCSEISCARIFCGNYGHTGGTRLFSRSGDLATSAPKHCAQRPGPHRHRHRCGGDTGALPATSLPRHWPGRRPAAIYTCTPKS